MEFAGYRHCAKAISDILQDTWKEMTILSFCCASLDVWFVILGKGNPNRRVCESTAMLCAPGRS
jgi:hypothetical protein